MTGRNPINDETCHLKVLSLKIEANLTLPFHNLDMKLFLRKYFSIAVMQQAAFLSVSFTFFKRKLKMKSFLKNVE